MRTRLVGRGLRPGEELLTSTLWGRRQRGHRRAVAVAVPFALFAALNVLRLGPVLGPAAFAVGILIAALILGWLRATYWVALGPDYVRVHTGLRYHEFRPGPNLQALQVRTRGGVLSEPTADVLYLRQGRRRATVLLGAKDQQRVIALLGVQPLEAYVTHLKFLPPEQRAVLPYWQDHVVATALAATAVVLVPLVIFAVQWVGHDNDTYRAGATRRLEAFATARLDRQPGWKPQEPASLGWDGDTDREPLMWQRTYTVPFGDKKSFLATWTALTGADSATPGCTTNTYRGVTTVHCEGVEDVSFQGVQLLVFARFDSASPDSPNQLNLSVTDHRD